MKESDELAIARVRLIKNINEYSCSMPGATAHKASDLAELLSQERERRLDLEMALLVVQARIAGTLAEKWKARDGDCWRYSGTLIDFIDQVLEKET